MARALKVFRTVAGFRDAYVAAPTKKAALAAWGSTRNLFALGEAEEVSDPALCKAPLARPGTVIQVSRGTMAQQLAALPADGPEVQPVEKRTRKKTKRPALPRPKRDALDAAEQLLGTADEDYQAKRATLQRKIDDLKTMLDMADATWDEQRDTLEKTVADQRKAYDDAVARWQRGER